jgi:hypothetical protein
MGRAGFGGPTGSVSVGARDRRSDSDRLQRVLTDRRVARGGTRTRPPDRTTRLLTVRRRRRESGSVIRFPYAFDPKFALLCRCFGVRPRRDGVEITDDGLFRARYSFISIATPLENIEGAHVTESYRWWTAIGVRASHVDSGLTFGTNYARGTCVHFRVPVPSPLSRHGHEALTVTVEDPVALVTALGF